MIYHIVEAEEWLKAKEELRPPSLADEGFIHCSYSWQVGVVARDRFRGAMDPIALEIDVSLLPALMISEDLFGLDEDFPHVYGAIPKVSVVRVLPFERSENGDLVFPHEDRIRGRLPEDFRIREAKREDAGDIAAFRYGMMEEMHPEEDYSNKRSSFMAECENYYQERIGLAMSRIFVARSAEVNIGSASLQLMEKPPSPRKPGNRSGYVLNVFVLKEYRRKGVAQRLMEIVLEEATRLRCYSLSLHASEMGRPVYAGLGFKNVENYLELELSKPLHAASGQ